MADDIHLYKSKNGKCYALEFLKGLKKQNEDLWVNLNQHLEIIKDPLMRKLPFSRSLKGGLFEVRARSDNVQARMNYCFEKGVLLLNGYIKNDKKSEREGVELGRKLLKESIERKKK